MTKYREIRPLVDAIQYKPYHKISEREWLSFLRKVRIPYEKVSDTSYAVYTYTGVMVMYPNDWLVRDSNDEVRVYKPEAFVKKYEPVE